MKRWSFISFLLLLSAALCAEQDPAAALRATGRYTRVVTEGDFVRTEQTRILRGDTVTFCGGRYVSAEGYRAYGLIPCRYRAIRSGTRVTGELRPPLVRVFGGCEIDYRPDRYSPGNATIDTLLARGYLLEITDYYERAGAASPIDCYFWGRALVHIWFGERELLERVRTKMKTNAVELDNPDYLADMDHAAVRGDSLLRLYLQSGDSVFRPDALRLRRKLRPSPNHQ